MSNGSTALERLAFCALTVWLAIWACPGSAQKQAVLRMLPAIESPDSVTLRWVNARSGRTYTIYRRELNAVEWVPLAYGLPGDMGQYTYHGFTLDRDWEYRIVEEE